MLKPIQNQRHKPKTGIFSLQAGKACRLLLLTFLTYTTSLLGLDYTFQQSKQTTTLEFRHPEKLQVVPLDPPGMTAKIVLKITGIQVKEDELLPDSWQVPSLSAVNHFRCIPYNQNLLLIVDLLYPVKYVLKTGDNGFTIELLDGTLRNPTEYKFIKGMKLQQDGDTDAALELYKQVARENRNHRYVFYKAGQIRLQREEYQKAEINFKIALANGCDSIGIYKAMATLYRNTGNNKLAEQYEQQYQKSLPTAAGTKPDQIYDSVDFAANRSQTQSPETQMAATHADTAAHQTEAIASPGSQRFAWLRYVLYGLPLLLLLWLVPITYHRLRLWYYLAQKQRRSKMNARKVVAQQIEEQEQEKPRQQPTPQPQAAAPQKEAAPIIARPPRKPKIDTTEAGPRLSDLSNTYRDTNPQVDALIDQLLGKSQLKIRADEESDFFDADFDFPDDAENTRQQALKLARELNLGQGEVELALKLSAMQHQTMRERDLRSHIMELYRQNMSIDEIAKAANLGKGEVELFLRLAKVLH
jgi:tetratricopeptide (TPR) repeat protein